MSLPGFTADSSLTGELQVTHSGKSSHRRHGGSGIVPSLPPSATRHACSNLCGSDRSCFDQCLSGLGGDGGGTGGAGVGDPHCLVGCGPCQVIGRHRQRACVKPDCSVHYIPC